MIKHVVWDWNGTLLDDIAPSIDAINSLLRDRAMQEIAHEDYRERFGFPVRDFYIGLGFDLAREDFAGVSATFIQRYRDRLHLMRLHVGVHDTLQRLRLRGITQHVVSAMEARMLQEMLTHHQIVEHVQHIRGLDHLNATSKIDLGVALVTTLACSPDEVLFVGDTLHDHETAVAMGCRCVLFTGGHQSKQRLQQVGVDVIETLADVERFIDRTWQSKGERA